MTRIPPTLRFVAAASLLLAGCADRTPDTGTVEAVFAKPAEQMEVRALGPGETLGEVLESALDYSEQQAVLMAFREQASPRRMRVGTEITLRYLEDDALRGVDVALSRDETVRLTRVGDAWRSEVVTTPVFTDTLMISGEVSSSLWDAVIANQGLEGTPYQDRMVMVDLLDRVFQWQLDFSRQVQRGDYFRVAFEREVRPDGSMKTGTLLAAEFVNVGRPFHAVWFDPNGDGRGSYFDLEGRSVRRAFLLKPLEFRRISSRFSSGRMHPVLQRVRAHRGVDYAADTGTPIMATSDGVVIKRGPNGGLGNAIEIRHPNGFVTRYGHMSRFASGITVGSRVGQGDVIGYVGATGLATGPHLHYEMLRNGRQVDPLSVDLPAGDPVPADDFERWTLELTPRLALLDRLPAAGLTRFADETAAAAQTDESQGSDR
ncbi:MAG TPA: peptidoglycan DD-metalloendopeptidase family protein [Longimicrobiales bacterium]|nr:peptidoglycan DD-metalloendopeptidase family protein [Longimicrobiales bacterium]